MAANPVDPSRTAAYEKNTKEQYEALGRFVEAFEAMVGEARAISIQLISADDRYEKLAEIALHHQNLAAKTIHDIFRAFVIQIVNDAIKSQKNRDKGIHDPALIVDTSGNPVLFTENDAVLFGRVAAFIAGEYERLANKRNNLLHASWFIGFVSSEDPNCETFFVNKRTVTGDGLASVPLPNNALDLLSLADRCDTARTWISWLHSCLMGDQKIEERFAYDADEKRCWLLTPGGSKTTLPKK